MNKEVSAFLINKDKKLQLHMNSIMVLQIIGNFDQLRSFLDFFRFFQIISDLSE